MTKSYYICTVTEILGGAHDVDSDRFGIQLQLAKVCINVKGGNVNVVLDTDFIDLSSVLTIDWSALDMTSDVIAINAEKTFGGDRLLTKDIYGLSAYEDTCKIIDAIDTIYLKLKIIYWHDVIFRMFL